MKNSASAIKVVHRLSYALVLAGSIGAFAWLISIPSEGSTAGGFSVQRLVMLAAIVFSMLASGYLLVKPLNRDWPCGWFGRRASSQRKFDAVSFVLSAVTVAGFLLLITPSRDFGRSVYYVERLKPIILVGVLWC